MKIQKSALSLAISTLLFPTEAVMAQESIAGFALEEVVVTARKREENLHTPIAVSAFTSNELKLRNIRSTDQLGDITPNLTFDAFAPSSGSNASSQIYIRGIGQSDFTAVTDPGVGLYIDGVYYARSIGGSMGFLDLAHCNHRFLTERQSPVSDDVHYRARAGDDRPRELAVASRRT